MNALTVSQIAKLEKHEGVITRGQQTFVDVGNSLCAIRDEKLYLRDYDTFEAYCQGRWGWSRRRSNQLIDAAELIENLPPTLAAKVENERDARALLQLEPSEQKQAIREAHKEGVSITEVVEKSFQEKPSGIGRPASTGVPVVEKQVKEKAPRTDCFNRTIPNDVVPDWDRAHEIGVELQSLVSKVKCRVALGIKEEDLAFREITNPTVSDAEGLHYALSQILPHVVCPTCQGRGRKACMTCRQRGWISKYLYGAIDKAKKVIIEKGATK